MPSLWMTLSWIFTFVTASFHVSSSLLYQKSTGRFWLIVLQDKQQLFHFYFGYLDMHNQLHTWRDILLYFWFFLIIQTGLRCFKLLVMLPTEDRDVALIQKEFTSLCKVILMSLQIFSLARLRFHSNFTGYIISSCYVVTHHFLFQQLVELPLCLHLALTSSLEWHSCVAYLRTSVGLSLNCVQHMYIAQRDSVVFSGMIL